MLWKTQDIIGIFQSQFYHEISLFCKCTEGRKDVCEGLWLRERLFLLRFPRLLRTQQPLVCKYKYKYPSLPPSLHSCILHVLVL